MVVLLAEKLVHFLTLPFMPEDPSPSALLDFGSKTSDLLTRVGNGSELTPTVCFEMMHAANAAFAKLAAEMDYPMSRWGGTATHEYLAYTSTLLDMLNSITSSLSHLSMLKISVLHARTLVDDSASRFLKKIGRSRFGGEFKEEMIEMRPSSRQEEGVILEALMELKKIEFFALGFVLSGLCGDDAKPCMEMRGFILESRFCRDMREMRGLVEEVSGAAASGGREWDEGVRELKGRLEGMEDVIMVIHKEANSLFFEVAAARNKVLDNIRF